MTTLTLKVPVELAAKLNRVSAARRISKSRIIREALERSLATAEKNKPVSAYDLMKDGLGIVHGGPRDLSTNKKHMAGFGQ
ncbi:MAG: ribbon-helix-helix domain-containing protein [Verrucomicrobiota bacterium]